MTSAAKTIVYSIAAAILRPAVLSKLQTGHLAILTYHGIVKKPLEIPDLCMLQLDDFRAQMNYLKKHVDVILLRDAVRLLQDGQLVRPTAVITFDDGYQSNHDLALPILEELSLPATIFLSTRFLDTDSTIWTGLLQHAFSVTQSTQVHWRNQTWDIRSHDNKVNCLRSIKAELKNSPNDELMKIVGELLIHLTGFDSVKLDEDSPYRMLNINSINNLHQSQVIELGAHTHSHFILSRIGKDTQESEIRISKEYIESITSDPCVSFAYPNGQSEDYDSDTLSILGDCGFNIAVTTIAGLCGPESRPLELPRITVDGLSTFAQFKLGLFDIPGRFRNNS